MWGCGRVVCGGAGVWGVAVRLHGCVTVCGCVGVRGALVAAIDVRSGDEAGHVVLRGGGVEG